MGVGMGMGVGVGVGLNDRKTGGIPFPNKVRVDHYFSKPIFPHFEEKIRKWIDQRNIYT